MDCFVLTDWLLFEKKWGGGGGGGLELDIHGQWNGRILDVDDVDRR